MLEELIQKIRQGEIRSFEEFYILTYETLYSYAFILTDAQKEKAQDMLIRTYASVYTKCKNIPEESDIYEWLYQTMDQIAIEWLGMTQEQIQKIKIEEENHETVIKLTEETAASILLSIEELLGLMEEQDEVFDRKRKIITMIKFAFACAFLALAVFAVCDGLDKIKEQWDKLTDPFSSGMLAVETIEGSTSGDHAANNEGGKNRIKVGGKIYYLSEIGQVLYSLPIEDSEWPEESPYNNEIQESDKWVYYLPAPDREDSRLSNVSSRLEHVLYRLSKQDQSVQIVAENVWDYYVNDEYIYIMQSERIQLLEEQGTYPLLENRMIVEVREDGIYLSYILGDPLETSADGMLRVEDRIYQMKGNRVQAVTAAECVEGDSRWYFETQNQENLPAIYQNKDDVVSVFAQQGLQIDSFCKVEDWIYYSACMYREETGACYSRIYRQSLTGGAAELIRHEFTGNITAMYYSEADQLIYAEYFPQSWENGWGTIAVITKEGAMSVLNDPPERSENETTGHDSLSFVFAQEDEVFCYWNNRSWIQGQEPFVIWTKPLVLSVNDKTAVP